MAFDQAEYWKIRGRNYPEEFEKHTPELQRFFAEQEYRFRKALDQVDFSTIESVLEVGCGFGRMTSIVLEKLEASTDYLAIDVSSEQVERTRQRFGSRICTRAADFRTEPLEPSDLVVVSEVFLHFPPDQIQAMIHKAQRLTKKYLVHIDPLLPASETFRASVGRVKNYVSGRAPLRGDWQHDYPRLYDYARVERLTAFPVGKGETMVFLIESRKPSTAQTRMPTAEGFQTEITP